MERDAILENGAKLDNLGVDLTRPDPDAPELHDRGALVEQVVRIIASSRLQPVLIGEPGVGKTSIVRSAARQLRGALGSGWRTVQVTVADITSGALYVNQLESKVKLIAESCRRDRGVLFLDEMPSFLGSGSSTTDPDGDVLGLLQPYLERGHVRLIGATTPSGWMALAQRRPLLMRQLVPITIPECTANETRSILNCRAYDWSRRFGLELAPDAIDEALELAERLFPWKRLPGRVCDLLEVCLGLLHGAAARVAAGSGETRAIHRVDRTDIAGAVRTFTGLPDFLLSPAVPARRVALRNYFATRIAGQAHVVEALVDCVQMIKARLNAPGRPLATFLLAGPTGVGKTLAARTLAALLFGDERRLIRFDMSEFKTIDTVATFVGEIRQQRPRPGLVDAVLAEPMPIILLDEIEKAHPAVFDVLLQAFGEGRLTDERGRTAHLGNAVFLMTSNLGSHRKMIDHPRRAGSEAELDAKVLDSVQRHFRPEFVNRLTAVFAFRTLGREEVVAIAEREIRRLSARQGLRGREIQVSLTAAALDAVIGGGYTPSLGARPMERAVDRLLGAPLARHLAEHPLDRRCHLEIGVDPASGVTRVVTRTALPASTSTEQTHVE